MATDLPPAYDLIKTPPATIEITEDSVLNHDDGSALVGNECSDAFEDKTTRIAFIQKVLAIKFMQMLIVPSILGITGAISYELRYSGALGHLIALSTIALLATTGLLIYCDKARRENPFRYLFLIIQPIAFGAFVSFVTLFATYSAIGIPLFSFLVAWVTYIGAVLAVLIYSVFCLQTNLEFAAKYAWLPAAGTQILLYAVLVPSFYVDALVALYIALALALVYLYIIWDLEFMTTKKYWHDITPEKYVDGALNLQLDYYYIIKNIVVPKIKALESEN